MTLAYQLTDVSFRYDAKTVLSIADLSLPDGQNTAVIGPNGSGKSTLLALLAFLQAPSDGEIEFYGLNCSQADSRELRQRVGWLAQKPYLLRGTVAANIELPLTLRKIAKPDRLATVGRVLEQLQIGHLAGQSCERLSGGEKQKVALARTLAIAPEVLIMDEPFSYLDQSGIRMMEDFIEQHPSTLVFSTHTRLQAQALAEQVITLVDGRPVQTELVNLYHGRIRQDCFETGKIRIILPEGVHQGKHIAIDPGQIVLSDSALESSMRNHFQGRVIGIGEHAANVLVRVDAGEIFDVLITHQALQALNLTLAGPVWVNFKSNALTIL